MAQGICSVDGCDKPRSKRGWCNTHYQLWRRNGRPKRVRNRNGWVIGVNGYVKVWAPEHPCALSDGYALAHRKAWHDAYGPIPERAHVHHVNGDRTDNRIENLELKSPEQHAHDHAVEAGYITNQFGTWPLKAREIR